MPKERRWPPKAVGIRKWAKDERRISRCEKGQRSEESGRWELVLIGQGLE